MPIYPCFIDAQLTLHPVCMRLFAEIVTHAVVHRLVRPLYPHAGAGLVREERGPFCGVIIHEVLQRSLVGVIPRERQPAPWRGT